MYLSSILTSIYKFYVRNLSFSIWLTLLLFILVIEFNAALYYMRSDIPVIPPFSVKESWGVGYTIGYLLGVPLGLFLVSQIYELIIRIVCKFSSKKYSLRLYPNFIFMISSLQLITIIIRMNDHYRWTQPLLV
jgi:hypothetical protein